MTMYGFRHGRSSACLYHRDAKQLACVIHGVDFLGLGKRDDVA